MKLWTKSSGVEVELIGDHENVFIVEWSDGKRTACPSSLFTHIQPTFLAGISLPAAPAPPPPPAPVEPKFIKFEEPAVKASAAPVKKAKSKPTSKPISLF